MDVHCSTCDEPWDVLHLWHQVIFDTVLTQKEAQVWFSLPQKQKLSDCYRKEFQAVGWEFGASVINVIHCPCCPPDARPHPERVVTKAALERLFGEDEVGLAATFEDYRL